MAKKRQFPDLPLGIEMHEPALRWADERRRYHTDELKAYLASYYTLTPAQLSYVTDGGKNAFSNYVDWLTARWTEWKIHRGKNKAYELTDHGHAEADKLR
jgi:hypothetical protein